MKTPLKWLNGFEATARLGSMTLAAFEVGMTQAALSQQIKALETRLCTILFIRQPRGVSLTASGTRLYSDISPGLEEIRRALRLYSRPKTKRLRVLCNTSLAIRWLLPGLHEFKQLFPDIIVELRTALWRSDRHGYDPDIEIFLGATTKLDRCEILAHSPLVAVKRKEENVSRSTSHGALSLIRVSGQESIFDEWIAAQNALKIKVIECAETDSIHSALTLVESGVGQTICPSFIARELVHSGKMISQPTNLSQSNRAYWLQLCETPSVAAISFQEWVLTKAKITQN